MPDTTPHPAETCGASTRGIRLGDNPPYHLGPCVLRAGHDGPIHQTADGVQWMGDVGSDQPTVPGPDVPDGLLTLAADAHEQWHIDNRTSDDFEVYRSSHEAWVRATLAAVLPAHERQVRQQIAAELRAAAQAIEDSRGEARDPLAEEIWQVCERDYDAPAVRADPRTIAAVAYRHIADRTAEREAPVATPAPTLADLVRRAVAINLPSEHLDILAAMARISGGIARALLSGQRADMERELGNMIVSSLRWMVRYGLDPLTCIETAEAAQRAYHTKETNR